MGKSKKCIMDRSTKRCRKVKKSPSKRSKSKPKRSYRRPPCDDPEKVRDPVTKRCRYRKSRSPPKKSKMVKSKPRHAPHSYYARRYPRAAARENRKYKARPVKSRKVYKTKKPKVMRKGASADARAMARAKMLAAQRKRLGKINSASADARAMARAKQLAAQRNKVKRYAKRSNNDNSSSSLKAKLQKEQEARSREKASTRGYAYKHKVE